MPLDNFDQIRNSEYNYEYTNGMDLDLSFEVFSCLFLLGLLILGTISNRASNICTQRPCEATRSQFYLILL